MGPPAQSPLLRGRPMHQYQWEHDRLSTFAHRRVLEVWTIPPGIRVEFALRAYDKKGRIGEYRCSSRREFLQHLNGSGLGVLVKEYSHYRLADIRRFGGFQDDLLGRLHTFLVDLSRRWHRQQQ